MTKTTVEVVNFGTIEQVMSVYSGKDNCCCCGCAGKHYYASEHMKAASRRRGYAVDESEVSDKMVTKVFNMVAKAITEDIDSVSVSSRPTASKLPVCHSISTGTRRYIVYWK